MTWIGGSQLIRACAERTGLPTLNIGRALAPELFEYNRAGRLQRPHPGDRGELGDPGARRAAARRRPGGVLQRALGQLRQPDSDGHRRGEPPVVEGLGVRAGVRRLRAARTSPPTCTTTRCCGRSASSRWRASSPAPTATTRTSPAATATSTCSASARRSRWCGVCPKCHFVFLALAPFMPKPRLVAIFGRNLLDDPAQAAGFDALLEYQRPQAVRVRRRRPRIARRDGRAGASARNGARTRWSSASRARSAPQLDADGTAASRRCW